MSTVRIALIDDHRMIRQGMRSMLDGAMNIEVVGEAANADEALELISRFANTRRQWLGTSFNHSAKTRRNQSRRIVGLSQSRTPTHQRERRRIGLSAKGYRDFLACRCCEARRRRRTRF